EAGIEVILDVVYNHTAEAGPEGPTYSFRGIDNAAYYLMSDDQRAPYRDYTGCGNTLACSRSVARVLVLDSLRYWVTEMHVDGFRFDLAAVLARNPDGSFASADDSLLTAMRTDPILRDVHLIAEPWDAGWAYQLGTEFPGALWHQLNFTIQESRSGSWKRAIDTGLESPDDIAEPGREVAVTSMEYRVHARSVVVLIGETAGTALG
ncbi:MAG: hypothetical protein ACXVBB_23500, partial [Isosphaeraceae bacterium]